MDSRRVRVVGELNGVGRPNGVPENRPGPSTGPSKVVRRMQQLDPSQTSERSPPPSLSDEDIIDRVLSGDRHMFEVIMRRHNLRIFRAARAITGDDHEAEDVMQHAYVRAYEHLSEFEGRASFSTWLTRIAVHEALARVRHLRRFDAFDSHADRVSARAVLTATPEQHASDVETRRALERAIDMLPSDFRVVFVLRVVEGLNGLETAECLGIPEETVKTRLHRARARLQEALLASFEPSVGQTFAFHRPRCDVVVAAVLARIVALG